jgi:hypothetical protein
MSLTHESPINIEQIEKNFAKSIRLLSEAEAVFESNRCLYCYDAPCTHACPTHIDVPSVYQKNRVGQSFGFGARDFRRESDWRDVRARLPGRGFVRRRVRRKNFDGQTD